MKKTQKLSLFLLLVLWSSSYSQYYGERVLQKSFEQSEFFFTPSYLNPLGIKGFGSVTPGLVNDPLLNLQINPANLYSDSLSRSYAYIDFRSNREIVDRNNYGYIYPMYARLAVYDAIYYPYPRFYASSRKQLEPVFSAAFLTRPVASVLPNLFLGATYQMIFQDEKYYSIPQDIYRSVYGYDYAGMRTADAASSVPVVDKYNGTDNMHQTGHFASLYAGYDFSPDLQIGIRVARAEYNRDGAFGSRNFWEYAYAQSSSSTWYNLESRSQDYHHWDISSGINYRLGDQTTLGVTGGYLWGNIQQVLTRMDTSLYLYGQVNVGNNWNYSRRSAQTLQNWDQQGKNYYGGLNFSSQLNEKQVFSFYYSFNKQSIDLLLSSTINDLSNYSYRSQYDTTVYTGNSRYILTDLRSGSGKNDATVHRLFGVMQWKLESSMNLNIGVSYESKTIQTNTNEPVVANRSSISTYTSNYYNSSYFDAGSEEKNLLWTFNTTTTTLQIPLIFSWKVSEKSEVLLGLNRHISRWEIEEVTLAIFKYRNQTNNSGTTSKTDFGERYTSPKETISEVQTTFLAGFTVSPSKLFSARLLMTPTQYENLGGGTRIDFQWWIGLSLYP